MKVLSLLIIFSSTIFPTEEFDLFKVEGFLNKEDFKGAEEYLSKFANVTDSSDVLVGRAQAHFAWGLKTSLIEEETKRPDSKLASTDPETGRTYYLNLVMRDPERAAKGAKILVGAIDKFSDRIDMRMILIGYYLKTKEYEETEKTIQAIFARSTKNSNAWRVRKDELLPDGRQFMIENLQAHLSRWVSDEDAGGAPQFLSITKAMAKNYPDHPYGHNNIATYYLYRGQYKAAIPFLEAALKARPDDTQVMHNLAYVYDKLKNKKKAITYYKMILASSESRHHEWAREKLKNIE